MQAVLPAPTDEHSCRCELPQEGAVRQNVFKAEQMCSFSVPAEYLQMLLGEGACVVRTLQEYYLVGIQLDCESGKM